MVFTTCCSQGGLANFHEVGRAMATLMSDEVFHDVAYKARNRNHLLAAIDEFLDAVTVLPPGEWDPTIRIEPPAAVPSQVLTQNVLSTHRQRGSENVSHICPDMRESN